MSYDTSSDPRLLAAEDAVKRLDSIVRQWRLPWRLDKKGVQELLKEARGLVYTLKYSYIRPRDMAGMEEVSRLAEIARGIAGEVLKERPEGLDTPRLAQYAEARYAVNILAGLRQRLLLGDDPLPEYAVDVIGVKVSRKEKLDGNLYMTRAVTDRITLTIVTNLEELREGEIRAAALLPPVVFHGVVSEAMYSSGPLEEEYVGRRVPARLLDSGLRGVVMKVIQGR